MTSDSTLQLETIAELDQRHDELLQRLEELDKRVEKVLAEWVAGRVADPATAPTAAL